MHNKVPIKNWFALLILLLPTLAVSMVTAIILFALPRIAVSLHTSATMQLWIVDIYSLVMAALLVPAGNAADRIGRKKILLIGTFGFAIVSFIAAFSPNSVFLLFCRALQGLFSAGIATSTLSNIRVMFEKTDKQALAIAIWVSIFSVGVAIGPIVGGFLLEHFNWGSVFIIVLPFTIPTLIAMPFLLQESKDSNSGPLDIWAIILSIITVTSFVYSVKHLAIDGITFIGIVLLIISIITAYYFIKHLLKETNPMFDILLFKNSNFAGGIIVNVIGAFSLMGFTFIITQFLQLHERYSPMSASLIMLPASFIFFISGILVVPLYKFFSKKTIVITGLAVNFVAYSVLAILGYNNSSVSFILMWSLLGVGIGFVETVSYDLIISSVPLDKSGAASGISESVYELGLVLGTAVIGSIINWGYRTQLILPKDLSEAEQMRVGQTFSEAIEVADELKMYNIDLANEILENANSAFMYSIPIVGTVCVVLMLLSIILAFKVLFKGDK